MEHIIATVPAEYKLAKLLRIFSSGSLFNMPRATQFISVTSSRSKLSESTLNGLGTMQSAVKLHGEPCKVPIKPKTILAFRNANKLYKEELAAKRNKEESQEKENKSGVKRKASSMDFNDLFAQQSKLQKDIDCGSELIKEASVRLAKACKENNKNDLSAAQALLAYGQEKADKANAEMKIVNKSLAASKKRKF